MDMSYPAVEGRIKDAIEAFYSRKNPNRSAIAREFDVPPERLRSRLNGRPSQLEVRGLHNRLLSPDQDKALVLFYQRLSNAGTPARLNSVKGEAIRLLCQDWDPAKPFPKIGPHWAKRWMDRQPDLFKVKRKPLAAEQKNAHDLDLIASHFERFRKLVQEHGIHPEDMWNCDEKGYRIGMARSNWVISVDLLVVECCWPPQ